MTHIILQQHKHAPLCQLFGGHELSPGLLDLPRWDFPASSPLVVKVQPPTVHLLQLMLQNRPEQGEERVEPSRIWEKASHPDLLQLGVLEALKGVQEGAFDVHIQSISGLSNLVQSFTHT